MESLLPLVTENLRSALWFQPEMALTFGTLVLFVIDLFWKKSAARVAYLTAGALAVLGVTAVLRAAARRRPGAVQRDARERRVRDLLQVALPRRGRAHRVRRLPGEGLPLPP